jgi:hypothetical protein
LAETAFLFPIQNLIGNDAAQRFLVEQFDAVG